MENIEQLWLVVTTILTSRVTLTGVTDGKRGKLSATAGSIEKCGNC
jgi:hypothetical protein